MGALFFSIFSLAEYPMNWIDEHVAAFGPGPRRHHAPGDLRDLLTDGVISGVGGIVIFLPQILILFFFVGLLESTGYMARAAFIMDRPMSKVGLNGRSFIPLLGCLRLRHPGIMATRTIENARDRLVTILVAPLMSCSARLPVYLLMIATLLPGDVVPADHQGRHHARHVCPRHRRRVLLRLAVQAHPLRSAPQHMIMELPPYQPPRLKEILRHMFERGWLFLKNAGTIILGISIVLWFLTTYPKHPDPDATADRADRPQLRRSGRPPDRARHQAAGLRLAHRHRPHHLLRRPRGLSSARWASSSASRERRTTPRRCATPCAAPLAGWRGAVHPARLLGAHGVLCFRHAVHEHRRRREARDQLLALAAVPDRLHDRHRLARVLRLLSGRPRAGLLKLKPQAGVTENPETQSELTEPPSKPCDLRVSSVISVSKNF
jgi:hypothetical protein